MLTAYITVEEADAYFADRLNTEPWEEATDTDKLKALKTATQAIDRLNFKGSKTDSSQVLEFPRNGASILPNAIIYAVCEEAFTLIDGKDPELEAESLGSINNKFATVGSTYDSDVRKDHIRAGIMSHVAWLHLIPFLSDPQSIVLRRV